MRLAFSRWRRREPGSGRGRRRRRLAGGVAAPSSTRESRGPWRGRHAAPGPAGQLPAGLGGSAAGLPEHPGERRAWDPEPRLSGRLGSARGQGSGSRGPGRGELEVRGRGSDIAPEGCEDPGPSDPSRVAGGSLLRPRGTSPGWATLVARDGPGKKPGPLLPPPVSRPLPGPRPLWEDSRPQSLPAQPGPAPWVTQQTRAGSSWPTAAGSGL